MTDIDLQSVRRPASAHVLHTRCMKSGCLASCGASLSAAVYSALPICTHTRTHRYFKMMLEGPAPLEELEKQREMQLIPEEMNDYEELKAAIKARPPPEK